jgi:hypothetical protein
MPQIRLSGSFSISIHNGDSIKSSSSLPTHPEMSFGEWDAWIAPKLLLKTFHELHRKVSLELERPARQGWEWIWVLEDRWTKSESSEPLPLLKEKLIPKRVKRSFPIRKKASVYRPNLGGNSSGSHGGYSGRLSIPDVANLDDKITRRPPISLPAARSRFGASLSGSKLLRGFQYMSPTYPHFRSPNGEPEGLYCKTKRGIGGGC